MKTDILTLIVFFMMGLNLCIPVTQKLFTVEEMSAATIQAEPLGNPGWDVEVYHYDAVRDKITWAERADGVYLGSIRIYLDANSAASARHHTGIWFSNVEIPQGATIDYADLYMKIYGSGDDFAIDIWGHDVDDAPDYETQNLSSRYGDLTSASMGVTYHNAKDDYPGRWLPLPCPEAGISGSMTAIIQEIINRPGWQSGNDISIIAKGRNQGDSEECRLYNGGYLRVNYTLPYYPELSSPSPADASVDIDITPLLSITVDDPEDDNMNVTFRTNATGSWGDIGTNISVGDGTYCQTNLSMDGYDTKYWWSVNVTDINDYWTNATYYFTTRGNNTPTFSGESPTNQSTGIGLQPSVYVVVSDADGDTITCDFYTSPDNNDWTHRQTNSSVASGTNISYSYTQVTSYTTKYYWKVTANDGIAENVTSDIYEFTTASFPTITINFAGNLSDSSGPYWQPPGESVAFISLPPVWSDGYYTTESKQSEDWIYINLSVTDMNNVWLQWYNSSFGWTNWTYAFSEVGAYWEYNTSGNIQTQEGHDYSFNIVANDSVGNSKCVWWNKTGLGGSYTRRYVQLNCTSVNISYNPYYFFDATYGEGDKNKADRLHHDQGGDGSVQDTGYLLLTEPSAAVQQRTCTDFVTYWFDESQCVESFTLDNIYYHFWWRTNSNEIEYVGWRKDRYFLANIVGQPLINYYSTNTSNNHSVIDYGGSDYYLEASILDVTNTDFTDNDMYELFVISHEEGGYPFVISSRSFTSFVLFNVPDNATLNASHADTDGDGLSDWMELYVTYTNPFLADTDNDGVSDLSEYLSGSDPNDYTSTTANTAPTQTGEIPANESVEISITPTLNITVDDANNNALNAYWLSNSSGQWVQFGSNLSIDTSGGSVNISQETSNFSAYGTKYWWSMNVTDTDKWSNATYHFTTIAKQWITLDTWNVTLSNTPQPYTLDIWNIILGNLTISPFTIDTWNMTLGNLTISPFTIDTWNMTLGNLTISPYTLDTWNITLSNTPQSYTLDTWNLTLGNLTISPYILDTWNITLGNLTISPYVLDTWNLTLGNLTIAPFIIDTWNITLSNLTISSFTIDTWNVTLSNIPQPYILDTWNLTLSNVTISQFTIDIWNITLSNTVQPYILDTWNLTLSNTTMGIILDWWNITLSNTSLSITDVTATPSEGVVTETTINITCNVTSPYAIVNVTVNTTDGTYDMANIGDLYYYATIYSTLMVHYYHIYANDTSGDQLESATYSFKIVGLSCSFTYTVKGGLMTLTPTITGATHYQWTFKDETGIEGQTPWIPIEDINKYVQGYVYPTTIRALLSAKNINVDQYANYSDKITIYKSSFEKPEPVIEEPPPEPTNIFKDIADAVGKWIGERNTGEILFMVVIAVIVPSLIMIKKYPRKKLIYPILKKRKKQKVYTETSLLEEQLNDLKEDLKDSKVKEGKKTGIDKSLDFARKILKRK